MSDELDGVAIVGMSGRFPGAPDVDTLWRNLCAGIESISTFSDDELRAAGIDAASLADPCYVRRWGAIADVDRFDATFFGISARDAEAMDPQQRLLLECAWAALESAGYGARRREARVGVYAGVGFAHYLLRNIGARALAAAPSGFYRLWFGNDKDFACTRIAHALDLDGPAITIQTACSTSLVAVCSAALALLAHQCDLALAGGASIRLPATAGYLYEEGGTSSPDGVCRAFDAGARGAAWGSGVAMVALKRLDDAVRDGDTVYAVIEGFAVNNDGSAKAGYTAPSVTGQAEVITNALAMAGLDPRAVELVEAHGTGTPLGDPIEVAALASVFGAASAPWCVLGSVKTNLGHLDAAAGVTGLIKAALALHHGAIPASLHFDRPNPEIDFASSPFFVNAALRPWPRSTAPRHAGVSAFGIGGTNAHVVLAEAPAVPPSTPARAPVVLPLSAKSHDALARASANLADWLRANRGVELTDVAHTLQVGREAFAVRRAIVVDTVDQAIERLGCDDELACADPLAAAWLAGGDVAWPSQGRRIPLPTYPFERERHWLEPLAEATAHLRVLAWEPARTSSGPRLDRVILVGHDVSPDAQARWLAALGGEARAIGARELGDAIVRSPDAAVIALWPAIEPARLGVEAISRLAAALDTLHAVARDERPRDVVWVTERGQDVVAGDVVDPQGAALWALARSMQLEHPSAHLRVLDVDQLEAIDARRLAAALAGGDAAALRAGRVLQPTLAAAPSAPAWRGHDAGGAVLVTGGLGALGLAIAEHLAKRHGIRELVLAGRRAPEDAVRARIGAIPSSVTVVSVDVADRDALARVIATHAWRGIVHAAGVLDDGVVSRLDPSRLANVLRPKLLGALWLDELTADRPLELFALCSSVASLGSAGQASYAAANAFLDGLAAARRARGRVATSIAWGPWEIGMAARAPRTARLPGRALRTDEALALFDACVAHPSPMLVAAADLRREASPPAPAPSGRPSGRTADVVREEVARVLGIAEPGSIAAEEPLATYGLDSLMAVELRSRLAARLGIEIRLSQLQDQPTLERIAAALAGLVHVDRPTKPGVVRLHPESPCPTVFVVGGAAGGNELYLRELATSLGPLVPCYALLYPGASAGEEPLDDVGALADYFVAQVQAAHPTGPLALCGHSAGGTIAFEMALRFEARGRSIVEVVMLDAPLFSDASRLPAFVRAPSLRDYLAESRRLGWLPADLAAVAEAAVSDPRTEPILDRLWRASSRAMLHYRVARPYRGEVTLMTPVRDDDGLASCLPEWRRACPTLKVVRAAGNHVTMVRAPHVARTARAIRELLGAPELGDA